ncbi:Bax inhibitor-1/YccA family protein [Archangium lansingense]|uniref:Bax inhibitor-1 family protein n=1 Tax=Archangium lansingense TaxID=2995310 RepID=A0ABT4AKL5_9BACT|nr:Bax inhibitor-1 family protein [Archangium lansinium]MCY1081367.1 Bax inhibitor-1 family protein [Archangium lansinium]
MAWNSAVGGMIAAEAPASERATFIRKTYLHLGGAVLAFIAVEAALLNSPLAQPLVQTMLGGRMSWLIVLGAFMLVGWVADRWARSATSPAMQYLGLGLYVVAEAIIMLPLLYVAAYFSKDPNIIAKAGVLTGLVFVGLTGTVFLTKRDFSWLRPALMIAGFAALGLIVVSLIFGFTLGTLFAAVMVVVAAGYILYYTSNVLHHYPVGSHVAAALALFSSVALLFWYILRIFMDRR